MRVFARVMLFAMVILLTGCWGSSERPYRYGTDRSYQDSLDGAFTGRRPRNKPANDDKIGPVERSGVIGLVFSVGLFGWVYRRQKKKLTAG